MTCDQQDGRYPNPVSNTCMKVFPAALYSVAVCTCQDINANLVRFLSQASVDTFRRLAEDVDTGMRRSIHTFAFCVPIPSQD